MAWTVWVLLNRAELISFLPFSQVLAWGELLLPLPSVHPICPSTQILSGPVIRNYTWQLFHMFRADQSYMEPVHCKVTLIIWPSAMKIWQSLWKRFPDHYSKTINRNHFIFSGFITLLCDLWTAGLFWLLTFDFDIITVTMTILFCPLLGNYKW